MSIVTYFGSKALAFEARGIKIQYRALEAKFFDKLLADIGGTFCSAFLVDFMSDWTPLDPLFKEDKYIEATVISKPDFPYWINFLQVTMNLVVTLGFLNQCFNLSIDGLLVWHK